MDIRHFNNILPADGTAGDDSLVGGAEDNHFQGGEGNDTLVSGGGQDTLEGGDGDDLILAGVGDQTLSGGDGNDTLSYQNIGSGVFVSLLSSGSSNPGPGNELRTGFENLIGSNYDDRFYGDGNANVLDGHGGDDTINGGDGNDTIFASTGSQRLGGDAGTNTLSFAHLGAGVIASLADSYAYSAGLNYIIRDFQDLTGSAFADRLAGDSGADVLDGNGGDDSIVAGDGADTILASAGNQTLNGGDGVDTLSFARSNSGVTLSLLTTGSQVSGDGAYIVSNIENLTGSDHGDSLTGDANANFIQGGGGPDTIDGGGGDDTLAGGGGVDTVSYLSATTGVTVDLAKQGAAQTTGVGSQTLSGFTNIQGSSHDDVLTGDGADNTILSGGGVDTLNGGGGSNTVSFADSTSGVSVYLELGQYQVGGVGPAGSVANFTTVIGSDGSDTLSGSSGNELLRGGGGDDQFGVTEGSDTFDGGAGSDTISFFAQADSVILDLTHGGPQATSMGFVTVTSVENIYGGSNDDRLTGGAEANLFFAGDGDDVLVSGGGQDTLMGQGGDDTILAGAGDQHLYGYASFGTSNDIDTVSYEQAATYVTVSLALQDQDQDTHIGTQNLKDFTNLRGSAFGDTLTGDANANVIDGDGGDDNIAGGAGADTILASAGNQTLDGGAGTDTLSFAKSASGVTLSLVEAGSQVSGSSAYTVSNFENLIGSNAGDSLTGDANANSIQGGAGNDTIDGGGGDDTLVGGGGINTVSYQSATNGVVVNLSQQGAVQTTGVGSQLLSSFTNLQGSSHNDILTGDGADNTISGGGGIDTIDGAGGVNTFKVEDRPGLAWNIVDLTTGEYSNYLGDFARLSHFQNVLGGGASDQFTDDSGDSRLDGAGGSDTFILNTGDDTVIGGAGPDFIQLYDTTARVTIDLSLDGVAQETGIGLKVISGVENATGGMGDDVLKGGSSDSTLLGGGGDDLLVSNGGADSLGGGGGNDTLVAGAGNQQLDGGTSGEDVASYADAASGITISLDRQETWQRTAIGYSYLTGIDDLIGSTHADNLTGDDNANVIDGHGGQDTIHAGAGADTLFASAGNQTLDGGDGIDTVSFANLSAAVNIDLSVTGAQTTGDGSYTISNVENLVGSSGADTLRGDDANATTGGDNLIDGGAGNDTLLATGGDDTLVGGAGADTVSYAGAGSGVTVDLTATGAQQQQFGSQVLSGIENAVGSDYADTLTGDAAANSLDGGAGADTIVASAGADTLVGGAGLDTLSFAGATGGVTVDLSAPGAQQTGLGLQLITGFETVIGSGGADSLTGDGNNNLLDGGAGFDTLNGGDGDDTLLGSGSLDHLNGGAGVDVASYAGATAGVNVYLNDATHIQNIESLQGSNYDDTLAGGASQTVNGGGGDDLVYLSKGVTADGGDGVDTADFSSFTAGLNATLEGTASETDNGVTTTFNNFEAAVLTQFADNVTINSPDWTVSAGAGSDILRLYGGGQVALDGGLGDDYVAVYSYMSDVSVTGDDGDDRVQVFGDADTAFYGGVGADNLQVFTSTGSSTLNGGEGNDAVDIYTGGSDIVMNGGDGDDNVNLYSDGSDITVNGGDGVDKITTTSSTNLTVDLSLSVAQDTGQGRMVLNSVEAVQAFSGNDHLIGSAAANGVYGGDGNDTIFGGSGGDDTLDGQGGTDILSYSNVASRVVADLFSGLAQVGGSTEHVDGFEFLIGSDFGDDLAGAATILAGQGDDLVHGVGAVSLNGGDGTDTLTYADATTGVIVSLAKQGRVQSTGVGDQTLALFENLTGSSQGDSLSGSGRADAIDGGGGSDTVLATRGADTLDGGAGIDTLDLSRLAGGVTVDVAGGVYQLSGSPDVTISNFETFLGTRSDDTFKDGQGAQSYLGGAGADVFYATGGADTFDGGVDIDTVDYSNVTGGGVTVSLGARGAQATGVGSETILRVENLIGSAQADHLTGAAGANVIVGGGGADTIDGGGGDDTLTGGGANSTVSYASATKGVQVVLLNQGGAQDTNVGQQVLQGFSNLEGSSHRDFLVGDLGDNVISAGDGRDFIFATPGNDSYDGGAGLDLLIYQGFNDPLTVDFVHGLVQVDGYTQTITGIEAVAGNDAAGLYIDDDAFHAILGGDGRDTVVAGLGDDTYNGGDGIDRLDMSAGNGVSVDLKSTKAQDTGMGDKVIIGFEQVIGSGGSDTLLGTNAANLIDGGAGGDDVINGRGGNDTLSGGAGGHSTVSYAGAADGVHVSLNLQGAAQDTGVGQQVLDNFTSLVGSSHDDVLGGAGRAERLEGGAGADQLSGLGGADTLVGGTGLDTLDGGAGSDLLVTTGDGDRLTGGSGTDIFAFSALRAGGAAFITDLTMAETVDLTAAEASLAEAFHQVDRFTSHAGEFALRYDAVHNLTTVRFDLDGNGRADHTITLEGGDYTSFTGFVL